MSGAGLTGVDATDDLGAVGDGLLGVESALFLVVSYQNTYVLAGHSLDKDLRVLVNENVWLGLLGVGERSLQSVRHDLVFLHSALGTLHELVEHI